MCSSDLISAGQINDARAAAGRCGEGPGFSFNGDAGIIRDFLTAARERVEECRLAAIGRADERKIPSSGCGRGRKRLAAHDPSSDGSTATAIASRRRKAMVVSFTRTAIGS